MVSVQGITSWIREYCIFHNRYTCFAVPCFVLVVVYMSVVYSCRLFSHVSVLFHRHWTMSGLRDYLSPVCQLRDHDGEGWGYRTCCVLLWFAQVNLCKPQQTTIYRQPHSYLLECFFYTCQEFHATSAGGFVPLDAGERFAMIRWNVMKPKHNKIHQSLQWRHNGQYGVSNHQPHDCLLNRLFKRRSKKASKLRATGLCPRWIPFTKGQ